MQKQAPKLPDSLGQATKVPLCTPPFAVERHFWMHWPLSQISWGAQPVWNPEHSHAHDSGFWVWPAGQLTGGHPHRQVVGSGGCPPAHVTAHSQLHVSGSKISLSLHVVSAHFPSQQTWPWSQLDTHAPESESHDSHAAQFLVTQAPLAHSWQRSSHTLGWHESLTHSEQRSPQSIGVQPPAAGSHSVQGGHVVGTQASPTHSRQGLPQSMAVQPCSGSHV